MLIAGASAISVSNDAIEPNVGSTPLKSATS
jgi:hypothetical protein